MSWDNRCDIQKRNNPDIPLRFTRTEEAGLRAGDANEARAQTAGPSTVSLVASSDTSEAEDASVFEQTASTSRTSAVDNDNREKRQDNLRKWKRKFLRGRLGRSILYRSLNNAELIAWCNEFKLPHSTNDRKEVLANVLWDYVSWILYLIPRLGINAKL